MVSISVFGGAEHSSKMNPDDIITQTNQYRTAQNLPALKTDPMLMAAAAARAKDMAATGAFSHTVATTTPGVTPWSFIHNAGYKFDHAGENLATLFNDVPSTMTAWKNSPGHNANLVNKNYSDIGVAVVPAFYQGRPTSFVIQMFGNRAAPLTPYVQPKAVKVAPIKAPVVKK